MRVGDSQVRANFESNEWQIGKSPLGELLIAPTPSPDVGQQRHKFLFFLHKSLFWVIKESVHEKNFRNVHQQQKWKDFLLPLLPIRGSAQHLPLGVSFKWNSALKGTVGKRPEKIVLKR